MFKPFKKVLRASRKWALVGVFVGSGALAVNAKMNAKAEMLKRQEQQWLLQEGGNPMNASDYVLGTVAGCSSGPNICGITAANDGTNHPLIDSGLANRIQARNTSQGDVFLKN